MNEEWLANLKTGDKVHVCNRFARHKPPLAIGLVERVGQDSITVKVDGMNGPVSLSRFQFHRGTGAQVDNSTDMQTIASLGIQPYTDEGKLARRQRKEKAELVSVLNRVEWADLPTDALDDICAILRENGVIS